MHMESQDVHSETSISIHFNEMYNSLKKWILVWFLTSIICAFIIDDIISSWINSFPFSESNLTVYSPNRWLTMRWGSVLLVGFIFSLPYASIMIDRFIKPALMQFELLMVRFLIIISTSMICVVIPYLFYFAPSIFVEFSTNTAINNVVENYDISLIYSIVLGLSWAIVISIIGIVCQVISRLIIHDQNLESSPMQWKIHIITLFVLYLVLNENLSSIWFPLSLIVILSSESIIRILPARQIGLIQHGNEILFSDGSIDKVAVVDCRCEDACPKMIQAPKNAYVIRTDSICLNKESQYRLYDILTNINATKMVVTGCDITPIPNHVKTKLSNHSIELIGLSWLNNRGFHPNDDESANTRRKYQLNKVCNANMDNLNQFSIVDDPGWGRYIPRGSISLPQYEKL